MTTARNRTEPPVNRRLGFEAAPYSFNHPRYQTLRKRTYLKETPIEGQQSRHIKEKKNKIRNSKIEIWRSVNETRNSKIETRSSKNDSEIQNLKLETRKLQLKLETETRKSKVEPRSSNNKTQNLKLKN